MQISEDHKYELLSLENLIMAFFKKQTREDFFPNRTYKGMKFTKLDVGFWYQLKIQNNRIDFILCMDIDIDEPADSVQNTFTSAIISDLIMPKFDLNGFLQQQYMKNQHTITKKLF